MRFKTINFIMFSLLAVASCDYCSAVYGEDKLGSRFTLVKENEDQVYILYCTHGPCCRSGFNIVPSKVEKINFDNRWVIATSIQANKEESYWVIDKNFEIDLQNCDATKCDSVIMSHVKGPLGYSEFLQAKESLKIDLSFD